MSARRSDRTHILLGTVTLSGLLVLGGCTTFGSNIRGDFACKAPDGICAPSATIDDRALAMIAGVGEGDIAPAGLYPVDRSKPSLPSGSAEQRLLRGQVDPRRTQERVLRIVFQPYIDGQGRLHEASAVHAVVQSGEWQQQGLAYATPIPDRLATQMPPSESLADAVDRTELAHAQQATTDTSFPDPALVVAARARRADPVKAIQDDVAARLAPKASSTPVRPTTDRPASAAKHRAAERLKPVAASAQAPTTGSKGDKAVPVPGPSLSGSGTGAGAINRTRASAEGQAAAEMTEGEARSSLQKDATIGASTKPRATVRAAAFPATALEEN